MVWREVEMTPALWKRKEKGVLPQKDEPSTKSHPTGAIAVGWLSNSDQCNRLMTKPPTNLCLQQSISPLSGMSQGCKNCLHPSPTKAQNKACIHPAPSAPAAEPSHPTNRGRGLFFFFFFFLSFFLSLVILPTGSKFN